VAQEAAAAQEAKRTESPALLTEDGKLLIGCGSLDEIPEMVESMVLNGSQLSENLVNVSQTSMN